MGCIQANETILQEVYLAGRYRKGWSKDHQKIFRLYVGGLTPAEIVKETGFDLLKVRYIIATDRFHELHEQVITNSVGEARKLLESKLVEAATKILRIMRQGKPDERLQYDAAKEVLYQCGMKPVEVIEARGRTYTPEEIQSSLSTAKEIQAIEEKLSTQGSGFLIKRDAEPSSPVINTNEGFAPQVNNPEETTEIIVPPEEPLVVTPVVEPELPVEEPQVV
jgi:hypothetical protein